MQERPCPGPRLSARRDTVTVLLNTIRCWYNPAKHYKQRHFFRKVGWYFTILAAHFALNYIETLVFLVLLNF